MCFRGWYEVFRNWTKIDAIRKGWETYCHGYSNSFRAFAQEKLDLPECRDRFGHDQQAILPASPKSLERNPKEPIERVQPRAFVLAL